MPLAPYEVELDVTFPKVNALGLIEYHPCPEFEHGRDVDHIDSWSSLKLVLKAHSTAVAQIIGSYPCWGFRMTARGVLSRRLLGVTEWVRSRETGALVPRMLWTAEGLFPLNPWGDGPVTPPEGFGHVKPHRRIAA
jgi:hypothetical protein